MMIIFSDEAYFDLGGYINKRNCRIWGTENPQEERRDGYSQWRLLSGHVERIFVHKNWRGRYWQHLVSTGGHYVPHRGSYTRCFVSCFWRSHYQLQPPRSCNLSPLHYYLWGAVRDKCYADKIETIDTLKVVFFKAFSKKKGPLYILANKPRVIHAWVKMIKKMVENLALFLWNKTLSSCQIWQINSFILRPNEYDCVYACTTLGNIATLLWKS